MNPSAKKFIENSLIALAIFLFSLLFIVAVNIFITDDIRYPLGRAGHSLLVAATLTVYIIANQTEAKKLTQSVILWLFFMVPLFITINYIEFRPPLTRETLNTITESNIFAVAITISLLSLSSAIGQYNNKPLRLILRIIVAIGFSTSAIIPISQLCYWYFSDSIITSNSIFALLQTNFSEAIEFIEFQGPKFLTGLIITTITTSLIFLFALFHKLNKKSTTYKDRILSLVLIFLGFICLYKTSDNLIIKPVRDQGDRTPTLTLEQLN